MRIAVTGGTGLVGRFIVHEALGAGDEVVILSRTAPQGGDLAGAEHRAWSMGQAPPLDGIDAVVHAAFDHLPGRYRGGEGDDPAGFVARNQHGTQALLDACARFGVGRVVFLSTRAVYGDYPPGTALSEDLAPRPDTLYGQVKAAGEAALAALPVPGVSLRVTGVYGAAVPGQRHKWSDLFADFLAGRDVAPRAGTEVHGADLAAACRLILALPADELPPVLNVSDLILDRRDLLAEVAAITGSPAPLPPRAETAVSAMDTARLRALGWAPGGWDRLRASLPGMLC
ncbi:NAD-dependent epimerase/dehydratase family protein [Anianabacter salinae]|uniref:NAD-dependent epimerase/dehydratase family protein n=1 Tax=Anianabacter salinae TaxID=2851023 RepID=UPI00225E304B|nr:NAD(P)-dependent oxidoreductase [Anianabacter salinae]MBV0912368.1 NAD(P)-dependent oxidoreductase [Anianabacter salinae]